MQRAVVCIYPLQSFFGARETLVARRRWFLRLKLAADEASQPYKSESLKISRNCILILHRLGLNMVIRDSIASARCGKIAGLAVVCSALFVILGAWPLLAQTTPPSKFFPDKIDETARALGDESRLRHLSLQQRQALTEFVIGNMLFVAAHELGHGINAEMELYVLGREEDAADSFAITTALRVGNDFSRRVLVEAAKGWFLTDKRDNKGVASLAYYDEHSLDKQRAYQIVCLLVGSDPAKFKELANETKLPEERQETCSRDYNLALYSWDKALKPYRRAADQPKTKFSVTYGEAVGELELYARTFRSIQFLEIIAEHAASTFVWQAPFTMEMRSCGDVDAYWSISNRKLNLCYEMAKEFAELYRDFGHEEIPDGFGRDQKAAKAKKSR